MPKIQLDPGSGLSKVVGNLRVRVLDARECEIELAAMGAEAIDPEQVEYELVSAICRQPSQRAGYVALARYLESTGRDAESRSLYRGNLPASIQRRFGLNSHPYASYGQLSRCNRLSFYGVETYPLIPPLNADENRNSVFKTGSVVTAAEYVDLMCNATVAFDGVNRLFLDENGVRNADHSSVNSWMLTNKALASEDVHRLPGLSLLLATRFAHNFYHWHFDCLNVLGLIEAAGIPISAIDNVLLWREQAGFQKQMLQLLGVRADQIKVCDVPESCLSCEQLLMVRVENQQGMAQSRRHLDWLRQKFLPMVGNKAWLEPAPRRKIALKRDERGFSEPESLYPRLEEYGYECIQPEKMPYIEQLRLFEGADEIVAPHGAGLSLLSYCRPGTIVHEFHGQHVQPCFWSISSALGLRYHVYNCSEISSGEVTTSNKGLAQRMAGTIDLSAEQLLSLLG